MTYAREQEIRCTFFSDDGTAYQVRDAMKVAVLALVEPSEANATALLHDAMMAIRRNVAALAKEDTDE